MFPFSFNNVYNSPSGACHTFVGNGFSPWNSSNVKTYLISSVNSDSSLTTDEKTAILSVINSNITNEKLAGSVFNTPVNSNIYSVVLEALPDQFSSTVSYPSICYP